MKKLILVAAVVLACLPVASVAAARARVTGLSGTSGYDVSFPNCSAGAPSNPPFGIVGVNGGTGYSQNPCLAQEAGWFVNHKLYVNTGWNSQSQYINASSPLVCAAGDQNCLAYNYGYNAGLYALNYANSRGISSTEWWLDVETGNTWNADTNQNRQSLQGEYDALVANGISTVGVYSTTAQWGSITGGWINNWPSWGATSWRTAKQAATYCTGHQFTGGPSIYMQYLPGGLDRDYAC